MLSLQEISDRLEIEQLLVDYGYLIDSGDFDGVDRLVAPDAFFDHSANGSVVGDYAAFKTFVSAALPKFPSYFHLMANIQIWVDGDTATSRCICFNPLVVALEDGTRQVMFNGFWYRTKLVRLADGWRIRERVQEACFRYNAPPSLSLPSAGGQGR